MAGGSDCAGRNVEAVMASTSRPLYVYLQRPDTGEWVTVGRYRTDAAGTGHFLYAPSYAEAGLAWAIDPVNLPFLPGADVVAPRYQGLHDVLRDACPDAWGQALLRREHNLPADARMSTPSLPQLNEVVEELAALAERRPPVRARIRARLVQTASVGGARPKATVQDDKGQFWLVKPELATDVANIPLLEHVGQQWGAASGLNFAATVFHPAAGRRRSAGAIRAWPKSFA